MCSIAKKSISKIFPSGFRRIQLGRFRLRRIVFSSGFTRLASIIGGRFPQASVPLLGQSDGHERGSVVGLRIGRLRFGATWGLYVIQLPTRSVRDAVFSSSN